MITKSFSTITSAENHLLFAFSSFVVVALFFYNYAIGPFSLPLILFLFLLFFCTVIFCLTLGNIKWNPIITYIFFSQGVFYFTLFVSFIQNGSYGASDLYFLISSAGNMIWIIILYLLAKNYWRFFNIVFTNTFILTSLLIIVVWIYLAFSNKNIFFTSGKADMGLMEFSLFMNRNHLSRFININLVVLLYIYLKAVHFKKIFKFIIYCLCFIIITSLSRANFITLAAVIFGFSLFNKGKALARRMAKAFIILLVLISLCATSEPLRLRGKQLMTQLIQFSTEISMIDRNRHSSNISASVRVRSWIASILIFINYPMSGVGYSRSLAFMESYGSLRFVGVNNAIPEAVDIHGAIFKVAVYGGTIALIGFAYMLYALFKCGISIYRQSNNSVTKKAAFCYLLLFFALIPMNIGADCLFITLPWISLSYLLISAIISNDKNQLIRA